MALKIEQTQKQNTAITQQLIQNIEILQMNSQELAEYVYNEAMENPLIDMEALQLSELRGRIDWLSRSSRPIQPRQSDPDDDSTLSQHEDKCSRDTLRQHLRFQLSCCRLNESERMISHYLIACVDQRGYLNEDISSTAEILGVEIEDVERCISRLRSFSPPGVCAANLQQCLSMQLDAEGQDDIARAIVEEHLESLARGHFSHIAKKLKVPLSQVKKAADRIKALSPIPTAGYDGDEEIYYSVPDAQIKADEGQVEIISLNSYSPTLRISDYYFNLYSSTEDEAVKAYLDKKLKSANWLIKCIGQRESTFIECLNVIAEIQRDYFLGKSRSLIPMSMADVADRMGVHSSTVSRAIRGRSVQCSGGVVPVRSFFSQRLCCEQTGSGSADEVKNLIASLVESEDKREPLSDMQLCQLIGQRGISISRRTVAKYREELDIPNTFLRKTNSEKQV